MKNLPPKVKPDELKRHFSEIGPITSIANDFQDSVAYIEFENKDAAKTAIKLLNGSNLNGYKLKVRASSYSASELLKEEADTKRKITKMAKQNFLL